MQVFTRLFARSRTGGLRLGALAAILFLFAALASFAQPAPALRIANIDVKQGTVVVTTTVTGFNVVDRQGAASVPGQGHVHFFLDIKAPTAPGKPAVPSGGGGNWAHVSGTSYTFQNVTPGQHTVAVELVNNDHTPLNPSVVVEQSFTLR